MAQRLRRLATVIADIATFAHDGINEEIPARMHDLRCGREAVVHESPIGILRGRLGDPRTEQETGKEPAEINAVGALRQVNAELFRIELRSLQNASDRPRR